MTSTKTIITVNLNAFFSLAKRRLSCVTCCALICRSCRRVSKYTVTWKKTINTTFTGIKELFTARNHDS